jgi:hypothetical protein
LPTVLAVGGTWMVAADKIIEAASTLAGTLGSEFSP